MPGDTRRMDTVQRLGPRLLFMSVFPSNNQRVRFLIRIPTLADTSELVGLGSFDGQAVCSEINGSQPCLEPRFPITTVQAVAVEGSGLSSALRPCGRPARQSCGPEANITKFRSGTLDRPLAMDGTPEQYKVLED